MVFGRCSVSIIVPCLDEKSVVAVSVNLCNENAHAG